MINFVDIGLSVYLLKSLFKAVLLLKFLLISIASQTICLIPRSLLIRIVPSNNKEWFELLRIYLLKSESKDARLSLRI